MGTSTVPLPSVRMPRPGTTTTSKVLPATRSITLDVPTSEVGVSVPYLAGRRRVSEPNVIWYGNLKPIYEVTVEVVTERTVEGGWEVFTDTVVETRIVVGYTLDIQLGICLGPDVVLRAIYYDNEPIWQGTAGPARTVINLPENNTPLSQSTVAFSGGAVDQGIDPWIVDVPDVPGYVGLAHVICRNMRVDSNLSGLSFEVERYPNPLALSELANKINDDANCASAVYDIVTNPWGGAGVDSGDLNDTTFLAAATQLLAEENGCSILINQEIPVTSVIGTLQQQTYSIVYQNPSTAELEINLIRQGPFNVATVPKFGERNVAKLQTFDKTSWPDTIEVIRGIFVNRGNDYEPTPVSVQSVANVSATGRNKRSTAVEYPYVTNAELCLKLASRDLSLVTAPLFSTVFVANRDAADLLPGQVVLLTWPLYNLYGVPVLVSKVRKSPIDQNTVIVTCRQYILPENSPIFDVPGAPYDPGIDFDPLAPTGAAFYSTPFWLARKIGMVSTDLNVPTDFVIPLILPKPANDIQFSFSAYLTNWPEQGKVEIIQEAMYSTFGQLNASIDKYDGFATGTIASVVLDGVINPANLINVGNSGVRAGRLFLFVNNEVMSFEGASQTGPAQWTLTNVHRGLIDTVPASHLVGADVYVMNNGLTNVARATFNFPLGFLPEWRLTGNTINEEGLYNDGLTTSAWVPSVSRTLRPPRPQNTKIDGAARSSTEIIVGAGDTHTITWATRTRTVIALKLQLDAAENAEPIPGGNTFQFHRVYLRDSAATLHLCGTTPDDGNYNSLVVTVPAIAAYGSGTLFVRSVNQFGESVFDDTLPVHVLPVGTFVTEDGASYFISEDGNNIFVGE